MNRESFFKRSRLNKRFIEEDQVLLSEARQGINPSIAEYLVELSGSTRRNLETILPETYKNMKRKSKLEMSASERVLSIIKVFLKGLEIFEKTDKLKGWMDKYNPFLQAVPFDLLNTTTGCNAVYDELTRIEEGILA